MNRADYVKTLRALLAEERATSTPDPAHIDRLERQLDMYEREPDQAPLETR